MSVSPSTRRVAPRRSERLLRSFLTPFVAVGWGLAKCADFGGSLSAASTFGQWVKGMLPVGVAFFVLVGFPALPLMLGFWLGLNDTVAFTISGVLLPVTLPVGVLGVAGMMRGTYFAMHAVTGKQLMPRHRSDPISVRRILTTCLVSVGALLVFALFMKLNSH
jgi:hypothetical protein